MIQDFLFRRVHKKKTKNNVTDGNDIKDLCTNTLFNMKILKEVIKIR